jgi:putative holliday junction resolvase
VLWSEPGTGNGEPGTGNVYSNSVRYLGVDIGKKRIGLAVSDPSALVARPWRMLPAGQSPGVSAHRVAAVLGELDDPFDQADGVGAIIVGLPRRLDGSDTDMTVPAREMASALRTLTGLDVHLQDERLSSREAEQLLAERLPDWRQRKALLDAVSAAVILQDYLDHRGDGGLDERAGA